MRRSLHLIKRAAVCACAACVVSAAPVRATIEPATVLDGPAAGILDVGGAALAADGSGGVVYRKLADGQPHLFVARFGGGRWLGSVRADAGQLGPATAPAIAAGRGGRLIAAWVQPWTSIAARPGASATLRRRLVAAVLQPGASSFGAPQPIDDVGDGAVADPSLALAPSGAALVVYRVVTDPLTPGSAVARTPMRSGDQLVDVRVARFNGVAWSALGAVNRAPRQVTMRRPTAANAPALAVGSNDAAAVAWQEPDADGVARIWARRIFSGGYGAASQLSPSELAGARVTADADAPTLAVAGNAQAVAAFRVATTSGTAGGVFVSQLAAEQAAAGASAVIGWRPPLRLSAAVAGRPRVAIDGGGRWRAAWGEGGALRLASGSSGAATAAAPAASTLGGVSGDAPPLLAVAPAGGGTTAWPALDGGGRPVVAARQEFPDGQRQTAALTAPVSGAIDDLAAGGSGLGDALIAFRQGSAEAGAVVAAPVLAPPARFVVSAPLDWVGPASARIHWQPAPHAIGRVRYDVLLDGRTVVRAAPRRFLTLPARGLGDARHSARVLATDAAGQQTLSAAVTVAVDGAAPLVTVRRLPGRRVRVTVADRAAGLAPARTRIDFGDGSRAVVGEPRTTHRYRAAARRLITIRAADAVGNRRAASIWVEPR